MEVRIENDQTFANSGRSHPSPFQQQSNYTNFGAVCAGFPDMRYHHPAPGRFDPINLPPFDMASSRGLTGNSVPTASISPPYVPNVGSQVLQSNGEDNQMMTTAPSRRTSHMHGVETTGKGSGSQCEVCVCREKTPTNGPRSSDLNLAVNAYNRIQSYPRVPVDHLLNAPAETQRLPYMATRAFRGSQAKLPQPNASISQEQPSPVSMSLCSNTTTSSRTIRALNISEERLHLLNSLYRTCQSATAEYIQTSILVHRRSRSSRGYSRYHPYASHSHPSLASKKEERKAPSLLDNISKICTHIWRKARRDRIAPHRAEADAVREMRNLYKWSEVVARSMESDGLDSVVVDHASDGSGGGGTGRRSPDSVAGFPGLRVAKAAKRLCQWVGDEEAWDTCDSILGELRDLVGHDGGVGAGERRESEFGGIE